MTDEQRNAYIASVVKEREQYAEEGDKENVAACEAELKRVSPQRKPARSAAQRRA